jgi:hypothetical protein
MKNAGREYDDELIVYHRTLHGGRHEFGPRRELSIVCFITSATTQEKAVISL